MPTALANVYHGWIIEDIHAESRDFYPEPVCGSQESTKNYVDTGELVGFASDITAQVPTDEDVDDDEDAGGESDGEPSGEVDEAFRGGVMSSSAR